MNEFVVRNVPNGLWLRLSSVDSVVRDSIKVRDLRSRQGTISPIVAVTLGPLRRAAGVNRLVTSDERTEQTRAMTGPARRGNDFSINS